MKNASMIAALKKVFVPALRERGFDGSFPHFRRIGAQRVDLLTVQFNKWGGSFVIEIASCGVDGVTKPWGEHTPANRVTAWMTNPPNRARLGTLATGQNNVWFKYDDGTPVEVVARRVVSYLPIADAWWAKS
jgi:hypothetical protein